MKILRVARVTLTSHLSTSYLSPRSLTSCLSPHVSHLSGNAAQNCANILVENDIEKDQWVIYMLILLALFAAFRIVAAWVLIKNARRFY